MRLLGCFFSLFSKGEGHWLLAQLYHDHEIWSQTAFHCKIPITLRLKRLCFDLTVLLLAALVYYMYCVLWCTILHNPDPDSIQAGGGAPCCAALV